MQALAVHEPIQPGGISMQPPSQGHGAEGSPHDQPQVTRDTLAQRLCDDDFKAKALALGHWYGLSYEDGFDALGDTGLTISGMTEESVRAVESIDAFLITIYRRRTYEIIEKKIRDRTLFTPLEADIPAPNDYDGRAEEAAKIVAAVIPILPPKARIIIQEHLNGRPYQQIAEQLNITYENIRKIVSNAYKSARVLLAGKIDPITLESNGRASSHDKGATSADVSPVRQGCPDTSEDLK